MTQPTRARRYICPACRLDQHRYCDARDGGVIKVSGIGPMRIARCACTHPQDTPPATHQPPT